MNKLFFLLSILLISACQKQETPVNAPLIHSGLIIGKDNRIKTKTPTLFPYSTVGKVSGFGAGTATLIADNIAITAAHVAQSYATYFYPGQQGLNRKLGKFHIVEIVYAEKYKSHGCLNGKTKENSFYCFHNDFAFLILEGEPGKKLGQLEFAQVTSEDDWSIAYNFIGYGAPTPELQKSQNKECTGALFYGEKNVEGLSPKIYGPIENREIAPMILNNCDADHGDSGSALITYNYSEDKKIPKIAGIQVTANTDETTPDWEKYEDKTSPQFYSEALYGATTAVPAATIIPEFKKLLLERK